MTFIVVALLFTASLSPQTRSGSADSILFQGGILRLVQEFGRAPYSRCLFTVFYNQPPMPRTDRVELTCSPNVYPPAADVHATRDLSIEEVSLVAKLTRASDLYSGGHVGSPGSASVDGVSERLEVFRCCGSDKKVILITDGNPTFTIGSRRDLLQLLGKWRGELLPKLATAAKGR